jgi:hypothetical protein
MKASDLVNRLLNGEEEDTQAREPTPSLTAPPAGMARYPRDAQATQDALRMVGDGGEPDAFFLMVGNGFLADMSTPDESYCIGRFDDPAMAEQNYHQVELSGEEGPRWVRIDSRLKRKVMQRELSRKVDYPEASV